MSCKMRHMECIQGDPAACLLSRQVANQKLIVRTGLQSVWESFCCWCCHHSCTWQLPTYNPWTACDSPNFRDQLGPVSRPNEAVLLPWTSLNQRRTFSSAVLPIPLMFTWQLSLHTSEVKLCFRQAGRRQEWGYKTQGNCWFGLLNSALPKDTKLPIPQWSLPLILLPWSGHIHLKMPAMLLAAKNLLPLKQQEEKKGNNWNDLLLQTASHLLWKWLLFIATERERIQIKYPHCAKFWAFFPNGFGYSTISRRVLYQMSAFVFSNTL